MNTLTRTFWILVYMCGVAFPVVSVHAEEAGSMTFTVTPPLFQLNLQPGESWSSEIRVVNSNPYDLTVYAEPVLFEPAGEGGRPNFIHAQSVDGMLGAPDPTTLAGWITVPSGGQTIVREQTLVLPLTITVPNDAVPGGHYAALLIGNKPSESGREEGAMSVTSSIASLIFLRVAGDVLEQGRIRDFATEESMYERAQARLSLRFENEGNVHIQPQGDITIYNMFNKLRGTIPVNQANGYGNVLPGSIRKFTFIWESDSGWWDIGRYRAEATLGYGLESKSFAQATTYFWVLPWMPLVQVLGGIVALLWFLGWAVRAYVRRALALEGAYREHATTDTVTPQDVERSTDTLPAPVTPASSTVMPPHTLPTLKLETLIRPLQESMVDLRRATTVAQEQPKDAMQGGGGVRHIERAETFHVGMFVRQYRSFFLFVMVCALGWVLASAYIADVMTVERTFRVIEERPDGSRIDLPVQ
ncbi:MAG: hypothetical protein KBD24_01070 [Candidatus Pacebacteria bacterium]|nr:hypothetical protein [Candidatus Paceibacterota bacterium]